MMKSHKVIVLNDYNPANEETLTRETLLPKSSSSAMIGNSTPGISSKNNLKKNSHKKTLFTQNMLHKLKK